MPDHGCIFKFRFSEDYKREQRELYECKVGVGLLESERAQEMMNIFDLAFSASVDGQGFMKITFELPDEWNENRTKRAIQELRFQLYHFSKSYLKEIEVYEELSIGFEYKKWYTILTVTDRSMEEISSVLNEKLKMYFKDRKNNLSIQMKELIERFDRKYMTLFPLLIVVQRDVFKWIDTLYGTSALTKSMVDAQFKMIPRISENELRKLDPTLNQIRLLSGSFTRSSEFMLSALSAQITISGFWVGIIGLTLAVLISYDLQGFIWGLLVFEVFFLFKLHTMGMIKTALRSLREEWGE